MRFSKKILPRRRVYKVSFKLPELLANNEERFAILCDSNNWLPVKI